MIFTYSILPTYATSTSSYYAQILFEQVYFFKEPTNNDDISNIYFELPKTYFVELLDKHEDYYKVKYLDLIGYVKKDCVQAVAKTPINPFLTNIKFRVYAEMSEKLWSMPSTQNNSTQITTIPHLTNNLEYIGQISGECLISGRTNVWYYCKYSSNQDLFGYVYSDFCDEMPEITANTEQVEYIDNPTFEPYVEPIKTIPVENNIIGVVVGILSIPALIFVFMIIKGTKITTREKSKTKEVVDY